MRITVERIRDIDTLLESQRDLYARAANKSFFISPEWFSNWLKMHPDLSSAFLIAGRSEGRLELLGVLSKKSATRQCFFTKREAYLNECGDPEVDEICIEHNDFLLGNAAPENARMLALKAILALTPANAIVFKRSSEALKTCAQNLSSASVYSYRYRELNRLPTYEIDLRLLRNGKEQSHSSSLKARIRRSVAAYEMRGNLRVVLAESKDEKDKAFEKLIKLHSDGWGRRNVRGAFANPKFLSFHRSLIAGAAQHTHLVECRAGDQTIGVLYNFVDGRRILNYQSGFLYEDDNKIRPGYVTHVLAANLYAEDNFDSYSLLAGDARYKKELGVESEPLFSFVLERWSLVGEARAIARSLRRRLSGVEKRRT